ncbi:MAG: hypothetical protein KJ072_12235 [Verrucomicrobia bacterium]|nr:hypothetical protein [Verrucomicrobiota bacterium]
MKLRVLPLRKSLLVIGLALGLMGCREGVDSAGSTPGWSRISPQPMLAQIGEGFSLPAEPGDVTATAAPVAGAVTDSKVDLPAEALPLPPKLSPGVDEVVQLARAEVGDEVLLAYIENSPAVFNLSADDILYLHDLGLSAPVIAAMIRHDQSLPAPAWDAAPAATEPAAAEAPVGPPPSEEAAPATAVAVSTASAPSAETQVTHNYFYNTLSPYGTWVELPEYGWCWRPTVAVIDTSWRPYVHGGRWVYTDYGWYWNSYYSWGWAPFHYGRWHLRGNLGWVWVPDTHWGPAWVTWRHCDGYYGWAPLPPGVVYTSGIGMTYYGSSVSVSFGFGFSSYYYSFVPVRHFYAHRPWNHCVPHGHVGPIYNNSTVINNYVQGDGNNTVINVGPGTGAVAAATRTEVRKVKVREMESGEARLVRAESLSRDGTTLNVYRPRLPEQAATPPAEITRRQQELQTRSRTVAGSEAAQAAVVKARDTRPLSPSLATTSRTAASPSVAPRIAGDGTTGTRAQPSREPAARPSGNMTAPATAPGARSNPATRSEPRRESRAVEPARVPTRTESRPTTTVPSQPASNPAVSPRQRLTQPTTPRPAWSSPAPRTEPVRPPQTSPAPAAPATRVEPARTVNPAYSVTPRPSVQPALRSAPGAPSPASPGTIAPRSSPVPPPASRQAQPGAMRPSVSPSPAPMAPSPSMSAPVPSRAPAPSVVPSRSSGTVAPSPSPSPSRPQSAPSAAPRSSGGTRSR